VRGRSTAQAATGGRDVRWDAEKGLVISRSSRTPTAQANPEVQDQEIAWNAAAPLFRIRWVLVLHLGSFTFRGEGGSTNLQRDHPDITLDWLGSSWARLSSASVSIFRRMVEGDGYELLRRFA